MSSKRHERPGGSANRTPVAHPSRRLGITQAQIPRSRAGISTHLDLVAPPVT